MGFTTAIAAHGLRRAFGRVVALDGLDLEVPAGTVFGLLGPNGAGKTTLVRILATLVAPTAGRATVLGHDVVAEALAVRRRIGLAGQFAAVDGELTGRENLHMVARLYRLSAAQARARSAELLERFDLIEVADRRAAGYSGGMRRRLDLAAGLIGRPPVVLLDEPTAGLDPPSRRALWGAVDELRGDGATVLLTTQYLEEADRLAQQVAVVDHGRVVAQGTPDELKSATGGSVLSVQLADRDKLDAALHALEPLTVGDRPALDPALAQIRLGVTDAAASAEAVRRLDAAGISLLAVELRRPTLDEVFLALTGQRPDETRATEAA